MAQSTSSSDIWDEDGKMFILKAGASVIFIIITQTLIVILTYSSCQDYRKIREFQNPKKKKKKSRKSKKSIQSIFKKWRKRGRKSKNKKKTNQSISPAKINNYRSPAVAAAGPGEKINNRAHLMGTKFEKSGDKERKKMKEKMKYEMAAKQIQFIENKQKSQYAMLLSGKFKSRGPIRVSTTAATANDFMAEVFDDLKAVKIDKVIIDKNGLYTYDVGFKTDIIEKSHSGKGRSSKGGSSGSILTASIRQPSMKRF